MGAMSVCHEGICDSWQEKRGCVGKGEDRAMLLESERQYKAKGCTSRSETGGRERLSLSDRCLGASKILEIDEGIGSH